MPPTDDLALDGIDRILVVTAHPDDVDFGAAGTIARWVAAGADVRYCVITDGDAGGFDPAVARADIGGIRRQEQTAAAAVIGVTSLTFLGYPDGKLTASLALRRDISRAIRIFKPQRVVCQSPEWNFQRLGASHPDHRAAGEAALCAVYPDARNPFAYPELLSKEGLQDWKVPSVWVMGGAGNAAMHAVDITDTFDNKVAAILSHVSQFEEPDAIAPRIREWTRATAQRFELPEDRLAEVFGIIDVP